MARMTRNSRAHRPENRPICIDLPGIIRAHERRIGRQNTENRADLAGPSIERAQVLILMRNQAIEAI